MKIADKTGMTFFCTLMLFIACAPSKHMVITKDRNPIAVSTAPAVVPAKHNQDSLQKVEAGYRKMIADALRKADRAYLQLDKLAEHQNDREEYFKEQRELNKQIIEQQIILFNRALKTRNQKDSTDYINRRLIDKLESYERKLDISNQQSNKANQLQKQVSSEKSWYQWTVLFCVIGTFAFTLISWAKPR